MFEKSAEKEEIEYTLLRVSDIVEKSVEKEEIEYTLFRCQILSKNQPKRRRLKLRDKVG